MERNRETLWAKVNSGANHLHQVCRSQEARGAPDYIPSKVQIMVVREQVPRSSPCRVLDSTMRGWGTSLAVNRS